MTANLPLAGIAVIGGGPAGLAAAEAACEAGVPVTLFEAKGSVGRKFLLAGKGGLNLTHSEPQAAFVTRYGAAQARVAEWLADFDAASLRAWSAGLGIETMVGSSGRVFPKDLKAAPLMRAWVRRLRAGGVQFRVHHQWLGWDERGALRFRTPDGESCFAAKASVFALGGGSWPQLGSDGHWVAAFTAAGIDVAALQPANCGFDIAWTPYLVDRFAGVPLKPVVATFGSQSRQGEIIITNTGIEGGLIYALAPGLREAIRRDGIARLSLNLMPGIDMPALTERLSRPRGKRSLSEHLRRAAGVDALRLALLRETRVAGDSDDPAALARRLKDLPLELIAPRPLAEAISSAGGVRLEGLNRELMLRIRPGAYCAGEMLDWEAPTGGYLLAAVIASGRRAGKSAAEFFQARPPA